MRTRLPACRWAFGTRKLLQLRQRMFGDRMACLTVRPKCRVELEFSVFASTLLQQAGQTSCGDHWVEGFGHRVNFRTPDSTDLLCASSRLEGPTRRKCRRAFCRAAFWTRRARTGTSERTHCRRTSSSCCPKKWNAATRSQRCGLTCAARNAAMSGRSCTTSRRCSGSRSTAGAAGLLREVHAIASAYGWAENDVLRMSASRRARYLGLIGA